MKDFAERHVVVTGGGGFLGHAVVELLLARNAEAHVPAFGEKDAKRLADLKDERLHVKEGVDLADEAQVEAFYEGIGAAPWASVHVAGGFVWGPIVDAGFEDLERMWRMNVASCWLCCRAAARRMKEAGEGGRIVNVSAKPALVPAPNVAAYAPTKAAVAGLTLGLAEELRDAGVWVNAVAPSIMDTPANREAMPDADFDAWPKVEGVAETIVFLASPRNATTRGAIVPVYGGS